MSEQRVHGEQQTGGPVVACHAGGPASVVVLAALGSLLLAKPIRHIGGIVRA